MRRTSVDSSVESSVDFWGSWGEEVLKDSKGIAKQGEKPA